MARFFFIFHDLNIAEKCFDIWGILKMATVKSVEYGKNSFGINHIIRCGSKLCLWDFRNLFWFRFYNNLNLDNAVINFCHNHPPPAHPRGFASKICPHSGAFAS